MANVGRCSKDAMTNIGGCSEGAMANVGRCSKGAMANMGGCSEGAMANMGGCSEGATTNFRGCSNGAKTNFEECSKGAMANVGGCSNGAMANGGRGSIGAFHKPTQSIYAHVTAVGTYAHEGPFRYTLNYNHKLTHAQREFYEDNGYIVIPRLIDSASINRFVTRFHDICEGRVDRGQITVMKDVSYVKAKIDGAQAFFKIQDISFDDVFIDYIANPRLLDYVEAFVGPHVSARHSMLINKSPDTGTLTSRHPPHQDLYYFPFRPVDRIVAAWTALEKITVDNGCLYVVPGTHKTGVLLPHGYPEGGMVNKAFHGIHGYNENDYPKTLVEMEKGDTVFFHPLLIHGSGPNMTKGFRKAISCHYSASECYYIDTAGTTQEDVAKEIESMGAKRGLTLSFTDIWDFRQRHVRGPKAML